MRAPNFLIFIVDQLCADHLGCYGNPVDVTPNIDALARGGWQADACYVATPICMPNRASLLTGRMPSSHGVRHNGISLSLGARTFVDVLRQAGWRTSLVGKSHLQNITDLPPLESPGMQRRPLDGQRPYPGNYLQECASSWRKDAMHEPELPFYGFGEAELAVGHGDLPQGHYRRWLEHEHPGALALAGRDNAHPTPDYDLSLCGHAWRTRLPEELHPTAWVADRTIARLQMSAADGRPFVAYCSFPDPHSPYTPPGQYWDKFRPQDMVLPASFGSPNPPPHLAALRAARDAGRAVKHTPACFAATEREARESIALNFGSMAFIDAQVGRVLKSLDALGLRDNTVVLFTSDHGEFAGDHQLLLKGPLHYRSLIRTPLIWSDPHANQAARSAGLISTVDIASSILERAGAEPYNGMQGRSFLPHISGTGDVPARDCLLIEEEGQRTSYGFDSPVRMRTLLTSQYRMSVYDGASWGELYDHAADPTESANLWHDPVARALRDSLGEAMGREMLRLTDHSITPTALA